MDGDVIPTNDFTVHLEALDKLCFICGSLQSTRNNKFFPIDDLVNDVESTFMVKVNVVKNIHPSALCQKCKYLIKNSKKRNIPSSTIPVTWSKQTGENCFTCLKISKGLVGGRPKKVVSCGGRPKAVKTIDDLNNLDPRKPLPKHVEEAIGKVVQHKMESSKMLNNSIQFESGGPSPITMTPISIPRVDSSVASDKAKRKRSKQLKDIISLASGSTDEGFQIQTVDVVKHVDEQLRSDIMAKLGNCTTTVIPANHVAAMKATENIPWNLIDDIRRWLKTFNVQLSTKNKVRDVTKEWSGKGLNAELAPLFVTEKKKTQVKHVPWCYLFNLVGHILNRLNDLSKFNVFLESHPSIPQGEVHIKIGGDHGGGSFKMSYQVANINNPNKVANTVIFSIFEAKDSRPNLRICLERYKVHIDTLKMLTWRNRTFRIFMFGDYEFLSSMYGISGAAGRHPCIWCEISAEMMQFPSFIRLFNMPAKRTLASLRFRYEEFVTKFGGNLKYAKKIFNVIDTVFFDIELDQVCLPGLHILMGVFLKIFTGVIERYCAELDSLIIKDVGFFNINKVKSDLNDLKEHEELLQNELNWYQVEHAAAVDDDNVVEYKRLIKKVDEKLKEKELLLLNYEITETEVGPCVSSLEGTLNKIGVERQAFHSNSFVGNHCDKSLKMENINVICDSIPSVVFDQVGDTELYRQSLVRISFIKELLILFSNCHCVFNTAKVLSDDEIYAFQREVNKFMVCLRVNFPHVRITPKLHMLEDHMFDFIFKWKTGCGMYGEQGGESCHNGINKMKHRYKNIKPPVNRLKYIMEQHLLTTNPEPQSIKPVKPTRKKQKL